MTPEAEQDRGERAARLLENDLYIEAFDCVENGIINAWRDCPIRDVDGARELRLMLKMLVDVKGHLKKMIETGTVATFIIKQDEEQEAKRKKFLRRVRA